MQGYYITAYRNLTTVRLAHQFINSVQISFHQAMIADLKEDSEIWEAE
jgi:hypothetical protein